MIEKLKSVLLDIRREREKDLEAYMSYGTPSRHEERKDILTLELPYKTDPASLLYARASAYQLTDKDRDHFLNHNVDEALFNKQDVQRIKDGQEKGDIQIYKKKRLGESSKSVNSIIVEWIQSAGSQNTKNTRVSLVDILQHSISNFYAAVHPNYDKIFVFSPNALSVENLPNILTMEVMERVINNMDISPASKKVYHSQARNLRKFIMQAFPISPTLIGRRGRLSLKDAAKLFEYLETRALKSKTMCKYHDILLCRALFYAPLPEKDLFNLSPPDVKFACLRCRNGVFDVPHSFIQLWKGFSNPKNLFCRAFDERQLHKKIQRLGQYAALTVESLTPSILRTSGKGAYFSYLSLSDDVVKLLPKRA